MVSGSVECSVMVDEELEELFDEEDSAKATIGAAHATPAMDAKAHPIFRRVDELKVLENLDDNSVLMSAVAVDRSFCA